MDTPPYIFIYPGLWRDYKVVAFRDKMDNSHKHWADFRLIPSMKPVDTDFRTSFLSSNYYPRVGDNYKNLPYVGKNTMPSISKFSVQTFGPGDYECVRAYLINRGWELSSGLIPETPYEIADIERIAFYGYSKWEEKIVEEKKEEEKKKEEGGGCGNYSYYF